MRGYRAFRLKSHLPIEFATGDRMTSKNPVVIVTGSSSGIGAACAKRAALERCRLAINYRKNEEGAAKTVSECKRLGAEAFSVQADVSSFDDCVRLVEATISKWGRIDGLVNNAGVTKFAAHSDLGALNAEDFQRIYSVNVIGSYHMTRAAAPHLSKTHGSILNISSMAALNGMGSSAAYAASKGALNTLTLSMARALAPSIRVNAICPNFVESEWLKDGYGTRYSQIKQRTQEARVLKSEVLPEDVAEGAIWMLLYSKNVTGHIMPIDGGFLLRAL